MASGAKADAVRKPTRTQSVYAAAWLVAALLALVLPCAPGCDAGTGQAATPPVTRTESLPADAVKATPEADPHPPVMHTDEYASPVPVTGGINTAGAEDSPFVTPDGSTMYFFFTPDVRVPVEKQLLDGVTGVYVSRRSGDTWSEAERVILQKAGKLSLDGAVAIDGDVMWFASAREGNYRGVDMWTARWRDGAWRDWENAGEQLNVDYQIGEVHYRHDGQALYFHSDRPGGQGGYDIWVTSRGDAGWTPPVNIQAVNSPDTDGWPFVSESGGELWFTRTYMGTPAIFRSVLGPAGWTEPELIVSQFAGEPTLDRNGNLYFVHHYFRHGQMLEADIYMAARRG